MTAADPTVIPTEVMVLPDGGTPEDLPYDYGSWAVYVRYMGPRTENGQGGYAVTRIFRDWQLSRAGNWNNYVEKFQRRLYRWATYDEALAMAKAHVTDVVVNGLTWEQVLQRHREQEPDSE